LCIGECPSDWGDCAPIVLQSEIRFSHMNALDSSSVQFEFYKEETSAKIIQGLKDSMSIDIKVANIGIDSATTQLQVTIRGVPFGQIIDDVQIRYIEDTTKLFLDRFTGNMAVFSVDVIAKNERNQNQKLRRLPSVENTGIADMTMIVDGAYPVSMTKSDFTKAIDSAFKGQMDVYLSLLKQNGIRPGEISNDGRIEYFQGITTITSKIVTSEVTPTQASNSNASLTRNLVCGIVASLCLVLGLFSWLRHRRLQQRKIEEDERYREERREERRLRRLERSKNELSVRSIDLSSESGRNIISKQGINSSCHDTDLTMSSGDIPFGSIDQHLECDTGCECTIPARVSVQSSVSTSSDTDLSASGKNASSTSSADSHMVKHARDHFTRSKSLDCIPNIPAEYPQLQPRQNHTQCYIPNHRQERQNPRSKSLSPNTASQSSHSRLPTCAKATLIRGIDSSLIETSSLENLPRQIKANGNSRGSLSLHRLLPTVFKSNVSKEPTPLPEMKVKNSPKEMQTADNVNSKPRPFYPYQHQNSLVRKNELIDIRNRPSNIHPSRGVNNQTKSGSHPNISGRSMRQQQQNPTRRTSCSSRSLSPINIERRRNQYLSRGPNASLHRSFDLSHVDGTFLTSDSNHQTQQATTSRGRHIPSRNRISSSGQSLLPKTILRQKTNASMHRSLDLSHFDATYDSNHQRCRGESNHRPQRVNQKGTAHNGTKNFGSSSRSLSPKNLTKQRYLHPSHCPTKHQKAFHRSLDLTILDTSYPLDDENQKFTKKKSIK
jgi:hypothetical protein